MKARPPGSIGPIPDALRAEFWSQVDQSGDCWVWTGGVSHGYGRMDLPGAGRVRAHRLSFYLATGQEPPVVRHACDNPPCVRPEHLLAGTQVDNVYDAVDRRKYIGRHKLDSPEAQALMHWTERLELGTKWCSRCERMLSLSDFNKDRSLPDGHRVYCRTCQAVAKAKYRARRKERAA